MSERGQPVRLFCSYSRRDDDLRREFEKHVAPLKREGLLSTWTFRDIKAGSDWDQAIHSELEAAEIIVLLISADFVASDYCWNVEMKRAMEREQEGTAIIVPVIIRSCKWQTAPFARLQALPTDAIPVLNWSSHDAAWTNVAEGLRHRIVEFASVRDSEPPAVRVAKRIARRTKPIAITDAVRRRAMLDAYEGVRAAIQELVNQITASADSVPVVLLSTSSFVAITISDLYVVLRVTSDLLGGTHLDLLLTSDDDVVATRSPQKCVSFRLDIPEHAAAQWLSEDGNVTTPHDLANEALLLLLGAYERNGASGAD